MKKKTNFGQKKEEEEDQDFWFMLVDMNSIYIKDILLCPSPTVSNDVAPDISYDFPFDLMIVGPNWLFLLRIWSNRSIFAIIEIC